MTKHNQFRTGTEIAITDVTGQSLEGTIVRTDDFGITVTVDDDITLFYPWTSIARIQILSVKEIEPITATVY